MYFCYLVSMNDDRIRLLEEKTATLEAEINLLRSLLKVESDDTTRRINSINKSLCWVWDWLVPVLYKVMPEFAKTRGQLDGILGFPASGAGQANKRT